MRHAPGKAWEEDEPFNEFRFLALRVLLLKRPDFVVDVPDRAPVYAADDVGTDCFAACYLNFKQCIHIDVIEDNQLIHPVSIRMHLFVHVNCLTNADQQECRERGPLARLRLVVLDDATGM